MPLSDALISMIIVSTTGILALIFKLCYSSKCKNVKFGCLSITRDTEHEQSINMSQTPNPI